MTLKHPTRRRFIQISAACSGAFLLAGMAGLGAMRHTPASAATSLKKSTHTWTGIALGADASLQIIHPDAIFAQNLIERCIAEVQRLEGLFSLYRDNSALITLNRQGHLDAPASDFLALLHRSTEFSRLTDGIFDITVQPLWEAYANYFSNNAAVASVENAQYKKGAPNPESRTMPAALDKAIQHALKRVDWRQIALDSQHVRLLRPGMALTLNGIAQGYITDRVTHVLASHGIDHALINMGEIYGLNPESPTSTPPWQAGLENAQRRGNISKRIPLYNQAVATSGAYGTPFTSDLRHNHLLDPRSGTSSHRYHSVSVVAQDATTADALSTAFTLMPEPAIKALSRELGVRTYIQAVNENGVREI